MGHCPPAAFICFAVLSECSPPLAAGPARTYYILVHEQPGSWDTKDSAQRRYVKVLKTTAGGKKDFLHFYRVHEIQISKQNAAPLEKERAHPSAWIRREREIDSIWFDAM